MKKIIAFFNHPITNLVVGILLWFALFFVYEPLKTSGQLNLDSCFLGAGMVIATSLLGYGFEGLLFGKVEYRCHACSVRVSCPAANTGVCYPCPHFEDCTAPEDTAE